MSSPSDNRRDTSDGAPDRDLSPSSAGRQSKGYPLEEDDQLESLIASRHQNGHQDQDEDQLDSPTDYRHVRNLLYTSHFLSTWNSRLFEFGAFLFLANIYPNTLLPASVYALARAASAAILSPVLGGYIDSVNRLSIVRLSIGKPPCPTFGKVKFSF